MTDSQIIVRRAEPSDAERIAGFQQSMAMETEGKTLDQSLISAGVDAVFDDADKGFYLVAESEGKVVGEMRHSGGFRACSWTPNIADAGSIRRCMTMCLIMQGRAMTSAA